ncbi:single-stranded-DNA-specific exonuclease RecJ [Amylibacter sp.]|jgi:single-stranded-DNA-specific exonuclease|nr:single-stranded-DNA-specific exonuclease RecJ [Rhodobacterales bacterium HTCC2255]MCO4796585.1 single-stranded-DNA-specific exonuclease RecJ [Amylibacter sp.]MDA8800390.1 single-stranded-DNA-specific exonuclease RecJ [Amylibacter sp.]MDA9163989.1 single-stranded-DNA-specific exonuclease RecJ [Amylibacter sp.]MDA9585893.1 single-stranded-DNA-specific exonuclease RecJ [Amylibacter sp.]
MNDIFLDVESSISGRRWTGPNISVDRQAEMILQETNFSSAMANVLARLGVEANQVKNYIKPSLRDLMPNPLKILDMEKAASRINIAVNNHERIAIFADYDVDGATSGALLHDWLTQLGNIPTLYVPDRIEEGYGPNIVAMETLANVHDLIICVDCGTLSHETINKITNTDIIILDHHLGGETLPNAYAVVNPNRQDEKGDLYYLCAAGVVFLTLVAANSIRRNNNKSTPDLLNMLDLVALGTVADVAPLIGFNRALVRQGLKVMAKRERIGITALSDIAKMNNAPSPYHLGYLLGPRINAGGRVGKADLGIRLLTCKNFDEANSIADKLNQLNDERRSIEATVQIQALEQVEKMDSNSALAWAAGEGWHPGVVGIVASRIKEITNKPTVVIGLDEHEGKGSGRSISGIDLGSSIATLQRENLIIRGGGHKMAAGLSLEREKLEIAMSRLNELLANQGSKSFQTRELQLDGALSLPAITIELLEQLETAGPFGAGAPGPKFALPFMRITFAKRAGESHLRLRLVDDSGASIDAIAFGAFKSDLGKTLENHKGQIFHVAGRLEIDTWNGRMRPKLNLEDATLIN